jgi:hypothetical protein
VYNAEGAYSVGNEEPIQVIPFLQVQPALWVMVALPYRSTCSSWEWQRKAALSPVFVEHLMDEGLRKHRTKSVGDLDLEYNGPWDS